MLNCSDEDDKFTYHYYLSASIVLTAFTFEAYLNHVGPKLFNSWAALEKLSPKDKLKIIAEKIELEIDFGKKPWQVINTLFGFRNDIAHGKSSIVTDTMIKSANKVNSEDIYDSVKAKWEKYCTKHNAEQARKYFAQIIIKIHDAANIDEMLFKSGMQRSGIKELFSCC